MATHTATATGTGIPGLTAGTWEIDGDHSDVSFAVRHMMVSKVRGKFGAVRGTITITDDIMSSSVEATVDVSSFDTGNVDRDNHVRSADFLEIEKYPTMTYRSTAVRRKGSDYVVDGDLTLHGVTRPVSFGLEFGGAGTDAYGKQRAGFSVAGELNRRDFGVDITMPLDGGGVVVGDKVKLSLEIAAVLAE